MCWGMAQRGIGIGAVPGEDGSAVDNQIASMGEVRPQGRTHQQHEQGSAGGRTCGACRASAKHGRSLTPLVTPGFGWSCVEVAWRT